MKMLTKQQIVDKVVAGLASQGFQRSMTYDGCAYRGMNGLKCAAGHLIPDEEYTPTLEGFKVPFTESVEGLSDGSLALLAILSKFIEKSDLVFLCSLQNAHDKAVDGPDHMKANLRGVIYAEGLQLPPELVE